MRVAIIGHGPSLLDAERGQEIDAHDVVVRMKTSAVLPQKFGHLVGERADVVCASMRVIYQALNVWGSQPDFWAFHDTRTFGEPPPVVMDYNIKTDEALCQRWVKEYRCMREMTEIDRAQARHETLSDDLGHKHCSAGMFSVIFACDFLKPSEITLYGFDNIRNGGFTWSLTRGPDWSRYPDHNWQTEARMLPVVLSHYGLVSEPEGEVIRCFSAM